MDKWNKKFEKHIKEREAFKRNHFKGQNVTCLTRNTNIKIEDGAAKARHEKSLFTQVLKRRKSRMSTCAPGVIDFDYAGNSAPVNHLIRKRNDLGYPEKSQLDFELKLRSYKNITEY